MARRVQLGSLWAAALLGALLAGGGGCRAQRSPYAGKKPIGYPEITTVPPIGLENKFGEGEGEGGSSAPLPPLPVQALGDRELVNRISKLPIDQQPFWYLNWQALEANRRNPQTFQPNQNSFSDAAHLTAGSGSWEHQTLGSRQGGGGLTRVASAQDTRRAPSAHSGRLPSRAQPVALEHNVNSPGINNNQIPNGREGDRTKLYDMGVHVHGHAMYPTSASRRRNQQPSAHVHAGSASSGALSMEGELYGGGCSGGCGGGAGHDH